MSNTQSYDDAARVHFEPSTSTIQVPLYGCEIEGTHETQDDSASRVAVLFFQLIVSSTALHRAARVAGVAVEISNRRRQRQANVEGYSHPCRERVARHHQEVRASWCHSSAPSLG